jgi:hypothetical protein
MATNAGDHAYGLCLAVLGDPASAEQCALEAMQRGGGRSRVAALAHARYGALAAVRSARAPGEDEDLNGIDLTELARLLSMARPPFERAIVDLQTRHRLDRAQFGRVLGMSPVSAATRAALVARTWSTELDPALLAFLGPGECPDLARTLIGTGLFRAVEPPPDPDGGLLDPAAGLLDPGAGQPGPTHAGSGGMSQSGHGDTGPVAVVASTGPALATITGPNPATAAVDVVPAGSVTRARLLDAVGPVRGHVEGCKTCGDRVRAMVSVRELLARTPLEAAPVTVRAAAAASNLLPRFRRPSPWPPPLERRAGQWRHRAAIAAGVMVSLGVAGAGVAIGIRAARDRPDRVDALTRVPAVDALAIDGPDTLSAGEIFTLANTSNRPLKWTATSPFPWLAVMPLRGALGPGERVDLSTSLLPGAPGGPAKAVVTITGDDGSAAAVEVRASGQAGPQVDATISGCTVRATVQGAAAISAVALSWRPHGAASAAAISDRATITMTPALDGYAADLPPPGGPIDWWVTATDQAGNASRSPTHLFGLGACPPSG